MTNIPPRVVWVILAAVVVVIYLGNRETSKEARRSEVTQAAEIKTALEKHQVVIGMNADQCRLAWGNPTSIHRTVTGASVHEQWVYGIGNYLYFDDGVLSAIQNTKGGR